MWSTETNSSKNAGLKSSNLQHLSLISDNNKFQLECKRTADSIVLTNVFYIKKFKSVLF